MFLKFIVDWILSSLMVKHFTLKILPYLRFSTQAASFSGEDFRQLTSNIKAGDIILKRDVKSLTGKIIGGEWQHVALYVGDREFEGKKYNCVEMTRYGLTFSYVFDIAKESDFIAVYRPIFFDDIYLENIVKRVEELKNIGVPYDTDFQLDSKAMYCSELIYFLDFEDRLGMYFEEFPVLKFPYFSPDQLTKCNTTLIWSNK